jgi:glucosamine-6-phosphate deaminase
MEVAIQPNVEKAAELPARLIATRLRAKPDLVLGLATGRTILL